MHPRIRNRNADLREDRKTLHPFAKLSKIKFDKVNLC